MAEVVINYPGIRLLMEGPGLSLELERVGTVIVAAARESVSVPRGGALRSPGPFPFRRSGDLMESIERSPARVLPGSQVVAVFANEQATHRGEYYPTLLRNGGVNGDTAYGPYIFVDLDTVHVS